jgi:hypothetical protein
VYLELHLQIVKDLQDVLKIGMPTSIGVPFSKMSRVFLKLFSDDTSQLFKPMHIKGNLLSMGDKSSFFLTGWGERDFFVFCFLLFSMCSHHVPKVFPNTFPKIFPIALGFYPIWFAQSSLPCI